MVNAERGGPAGMKQRWGDEVRDERADFGEYADVRLLAELASEAEQSGWDGFWVWDHIQWSGEAEGEPRQPAADPTVALALIAAATSRVRLGPW